MVGLPWSAEVFSAFSLRGAIADDGQGYVLREQRVFGKGEVEDQM